MNTPPPPLVLEADGWLQGAARAPSPHRCPRTPPPQVTLAVLHGISLPPRQFGGDAIGRLFTGRLDCDAHPYYARLRGLRVSAHFLICRRGSLRQFVSTEECAWHAGDSSWRGRANCNAFSVGIELEGCDDIPYTNAQYARLAALLPALAARYPNIAAAGHCHIAPARKTDPGAAFDWRRLFNDIGEHYDGRPA